MHKKDDSYKKTMLVINEYSKLMEMEKGIRNTLYGLDYAGLDKIYDGKIHVIALGYSINKKMEYEEGRKYFYLVVDKLIEQINKNTNLEKYFFHYPIDYRDLEFHLSFEEDKNEIPMRGKLDSIHIVRNEIFYEIVDQEGFNHPEIDELIPDVYITKDLLSRNHSIIRTISEDLALHSNSKEFQKKSGI